jgi:hypothetical protein
MNVAPRLGTIVGLFLPVFPGAADADDIHCAVRELGEDRRLSAVAKVR